MTFNPVFAGSRHWLTFLPGRLPAPIGLHPIASAIYTYAQLMPHPFHRLPLASPVKRTRHLSSLAQHLDLTVPSATGGNSMGSLSPWHWAILAVVVIVLFGANRLPDAARSLGKSMRIFKSEIHELHPDGPDPAVAPVSQASTVLRPEPTQSAIVTDRRA
jgi:sec-independent protein translocase protein TatA